MDPAVAAEQGIDGIREGLIRRIRLSVDPKHMVLLHIDIAESRRII